ncbi:MAG: DUF3592 domain-containing protein [Chloroflexota bacterium]
MYTQKPAPPTLLKVSLNDFIVSLSGILGISVLVGMIIMIFQTPARDRENGFWEAVGVMVLIALVCLAVMAWRAWQRQKAVHRAWEEGTLTTGTILSVQDVGFGRNRQRVLRYSYQYNGQDYEAGTNVKRNWQPSGDTISLIVDPQKPEKPFLVFQYAE